jgi:hypothetical protein
LQEDFLLARSMFNEGAKGITKLCKLRLCPFWLREQTAIFPPQDSSNEFLAERQRPQSTEAKQSIALTTTIYFLKGISTL